MDATTLQYRSEANALFVEGVRIVIDPGLFSLPAGLYRYGANDRLVNIASGTQVIGLTPSELTALNDAWPDLVALAVDAYAAMWIQTVTGDRNQQVEDMLLWIVRLQTGDALDSEEEEYADALRVWLGQVRDTKADKHEELEEAGALETFDLFSDWPPFPPESY